MVDQGPEDTFITDDVRIYPLLLAYSASSATTLVVCIATIVNQWASPKGSLTDDNLITLLTAHTPFLLVCLVMSLDMGQRLTKLVGTAVIVKKTN